MERDIGGDLRNCFKNAMSNAVFGKDHLQTHTFERLPPGQAPCALATNSDNDVQMHTGQDTDYRSEKTMVD